MYAKTLVPGPIPIPGLLATTSDETAIHDLLDRGWGSLGEPTMPQNAFVRLGLLGLQVVVEGKAMLDDESNPSPPNGWWDALKMTQEHIVVQVVLNTDLPDPSAPDVGVKLKAVMDQGGGACAFVPMHEWL